jgi:hypothetical protein
MTTTTENTVPVTEPAELRIHIDTDEPPLCWADTYPEAEATRLALRAFVPGPPRDARRDDDNSQIMGRRALRSGLCRPQGGDRRPHALTDLELSSLPPADAYDTRTRASGPGRRGAPGHGPLPCRARHRGHLPIHR